MTEEKIKIYVVHEDVAHEFGQILDVTRSYDIARKYIDEKISGKPYGGTWHYKLDLDGSETWEDNYTQFSIQVWNV